MPTTQLISINTGSDANAGDGATIRAAFTVVNDNTDKLNNQLNGTRTQSLTYPLTYITANNDISANNGTVYGQTVRGGVVYSRGSEVLTSSSGTWNGGNVSLYGIFSNTDPSISTTSGALQVAGGLGVGGNVFVGGLVNIAGNLTAGNLNISSGLTVSSLAVATSSQFVGTALFTGDVTAGNVSLGNLTTTSNITVTGNVNTTTLRSTQIYGSIATGSQSGITAVGTLTGLFSTGNVIVNNTIYGRGVYDNGARVVSTSSGDGNLSISNGNISLPSTGPGAGTFGSSTVIPIITTDSYGRISSVTTGTIPPQNITINLAGTTGTGNISGGGTLTFSSGNGVGIAVANSTLTISTAQDLQTTASPTFATINTGNIVPTANNVSNIGTTSYRYNTIFAKATSAQYADLAEIYESDAEYEPGTVLVFGTTTEVTISTRHEDNRVAGVVTTNPAYLMNSTATGVAVALQGRVPCRVVGTIRRGDMMVTSDIAGVATSCMPPFGPHIGTVIGKALENYNSDQVGVIEIVVGRV
jgi:hypothetical protein